MAVHSGGGSVRRRDPVADNLDKVRRAAEQGMDVAEQAWKTAGDVSRKAGDAAVKVLSEAGKHVPVANPGGQAARTSLYHNPTAAGSGGRTTTGGKVDREWQNHKWVSRERNADGKWIYEYGDSVSGGNNKQSTKAGQARFNLKETNKKTASRNTGRTQLQRASDKFDHDIRPARDAVNNAVNTGRDFIHNITKDTPLSDLFKN